MSEMMHTPALQRFEIYRLPCRYKQYIENMKYKVTTI